VALLEPIGVRERTGGGDLAQQGGLRARIDADLRQRPLGGLIGVSAQQMEGGGQLLGDLVQDQVVIGELTRGVHSRLRERPARRARGGRVNRSLTVRRCVVSEYSLIYRRGRGTETATDP